MQKTSIKLPEGLWKRFRIRALEEGREAQVIVAELIGEYLSRKAKKGATLVVGGLLLALSLVLPMQAQTAEQAQMAASFRGVPFGSSFEETNKVLVFKEKSLADCRAAKGLENWEYRVCRVAKPEPIGPFKRLDESVGFIHGRFAGVSIAFERFYGDIDSLKEIFVAKYGEPTKVVDTTGAPRADEKNYTIEKALSWETDAQSVELYQFWTYRYDDGSAPLSSLILSRPVRSEPKVELVPGSHPTAQIQSREEREMNKALAEARKTKAAKAF